MTPAAPLPVRFGVFELDSEAGQLRREGRVVRLSPQPFKLLEMLTAKQGRLVSREDIRKALWPEDTFIDFEQGVNFAIKQVREALKDNADRPLYVQTIPKRGYRFIAPVESPAPPVLGRGTTELKLQKVLWTNIAEMRLAEAARQARTQMLMKAAALGAAVIVVVALLLWFLR